MNWITALVTILGVVTLEGIIKVVDRIVFRKQEKKVKENEVKSTAEDVEEKQIRNDDAQIDLGNKFLQSTLEMTQKMQDMMISSNKERDDYWKKQEESMRSLGVSINEVKSDVNTLNMKVSDIESFLNGEYKAYKEKNIKKYEKRYSGKATPA